MKHNKKLLKIIGIGLFSLTVIFLLAFVNTNQKNALLEDIKIEIENDSVYQLISEIELMQILAENQLALKGQKINDINFQKLETILGRHPAIAKIDAFCTINGTLTIVIAQKQPILRAISQSDEHYYIDKEGYILPGSFPNGMRVMVANGFIDDECFRSNQRLDSIQSDGFMSTCADLFQWAKLIESDSLLKPLIEQIYRTETGEYELIPKTGPERIYAGYASNLSDKALKIQLFYRQGLHQIEQDEPYSIDIRFKDQIVFKKIKLVNNHSSNQTTWQTQN